MRVLLYEWCCSGGLLGPDRGVFLADAAADATAIAGEGRAMLIALIDDALRESGWSVSVLVDATRPLDLPAGVVAHPVVAGEEERALVEGALAADVTVIVAPETAGILARRLATLRASGVDVLAPGLEFVAVAGDKQATLTALAGAGLPVPAGRALPAAAPWPQGFIRPAVRKRRDGVGCDGFERTDPGDPSPAPSPHPTRIEAYVVGKPASVACLCGGGRVVPLPPLWQRLTAGPGPVYVGGEPILDGGPRDRATRLAVRAIRALERATATAARGWVGVDVVLGAGADGRQDRVLEVNPRLTTSFLGHTRPRGDSLLGHAIALDRDPDRAASIPMTEPIAFEVCTDDAPVVS